MAKKQDDQATIGGIRLHTEAPKKLEPEPAPDPIKPRGVGLKQSEWERFDRIAAELGMNSHKLSLWALRDFIRRYEAGEIETKQSKRLA
jgi:hypothetical protein